MIPVLRDGPFITNPLVLAHDGGNHWRAAFAGSDVVRIPCGARRPLVLEHKNSGDLSWVQPTDILSLSSLWLGMICFSGRQHFVAAKSSVVDERGFDVLAVKAIHPWPVQGGPPMIVINGVTTPISIGLYS